MSVVWDDRGVTTQFRHSAAVPVAGALGLASALALGTSRWWLSPILLLPLAVVVWGLRSGVDVDSTGLVVRSAVARRRLPWSDIAGFDVRGRRVTAQLRRGGAVVLPAVTPADLPRVLAAGGQDLEHPEAQ